MRKILCLSLALALCLCLCSCKSSDYKNAMSLYEAGDYAQAIAAFEALDGYKDSAAKIEECKIEIQYHDAVALMEAAQYEEAIAAFDVLDGYKDSVSLIEECETAILDQKYHNAVAFLDSGKIIEAYDALIALDGYKDSAEKAAAIYTEYEVAKLQQAEAGDCVIFGTYEQDNDTSNGKEAIKWHIFIKNPEAVFVISEFALDCQPYHTSNTPVSWETCSLRKWLNNDFMEAAFSADEKALIQTVTVPGEKTYSRTTKDQIFVLSIDEASRFWWADFGRQCKPTAYAAANGVISTEGYCNWWLRDTSDNDGYVEIVGSSGSIDYTNGKSFMLVDSDTGAVRPAMWISIES